MSWQLAICCFQWNIVAFSTLEFNVITHVNENHTSLGGGLVAAAPYFILLTSANIFSGLVKICCLKRCFP